MRIRNPSDRSFARFIDESKRRRGGGRTKLFIPSKDTHNISVFTADDAPDSDLEQAGTHVARERRRRNLYGWAIFYESILSEQQLGVVPDPDGLTFGVCKHMNVQGWPMSNPSRVMDIAQELAEAACWRVLPEPIPSGFSS